MAKAYKAASVFALSLALALSLLGCSLSATRNVQLDGFSIEVPSGWEVRNISEDIVRIVEPESDGGSFGISVNYFDADGKSDYASEFDFIIEDSDDHTTSNVEEYFIDGYPMITCIQHYEKVDSEDIYITAFFYDDSKFAVIMSYPSSEEEIEWSESIKDKIEINK